MTAIDLQSDEDSFGRGEMHLSAALEEGDVVVYQTGSWYVDGVLVGDDVPPSFDYCCVDTLQIVWTHNCEHGVIRGLKLHLSTGEESSPNRLLLSMDPSYEHVEFGPEQLLARIPVEWVNEKDCRAQVEAGEDLWKHHTLLE
jgi:hypothetical protein